MPCPICARCAVEMRCKKNDFLVRDPEVGQFASTYWRGDLYECPVCGAQVVTGFSAPLSLNPGAEAPEALEFQYEPPQKEKPDGDPTAV